MSIAKHPVFWLGIALSLPTAATALDDDSRAFMLAASCTACHGPDGQSPGAIPPLHGKSRRFIAMALQDYRSGDSIGTVMNRIAKGYTDEEIQLIAAYYGDQKP